MTEGPEDHAVSARIRALEARIAELEARLEAQNGILDGLRRRPRLPMPFPVMLGRLRHHPPRALTFPPHYSAAVPPDPAPSIAIVTPSFGQGRFIRATIESVLGQGYSRLAYHVQDGGSTDETRAILDGYQGRISFVSAPDGGQTDAINRGFAEVGGDIMAYLNSDDMLAPGSLAAVARAFAENPGVDLVYGHRVLIDGLGREIGRWVLPPHHVRVTRYADYVPQETLFWRRRVFEALGGFDTSFSYAMDWDFILRAQEKGFRFLRLPRFIGCFRVHDTQKTTSMPTTGHDESTRLRLRSLGHVPSSFEISNALRLYLAHHAVLHRLYKNKLLRH